MLYISFFFTAPPPTEIYTLSLHDALPIFGNSKKFHAVLLELRDGLANVFAQQRNVLRAGRAIKIDEIGRAHSELQSPCNLVCRLLLEKKKPTHINKLKKYMTHAQKRSSTR